MYSLFAAAAPDGNEVAVDAFEFQTEVFFTTELGDSRKIDLILALVMYTVVIELVSMCRLLVAWKIVAACTVSVECSFVILGLYNDINY